MNTARPFKVELVGRGSITLRPADYLATGGEGSVYRAHDTIVKLYTDTKKMIRDGMPEKIQLLKSLAHPYIVAPQGIVNDTSGNPIGYYMPYVSGESLVRLFTTDFRQRESFGDPETKTLVERMRETTMFTHQHSAVMVDANELNWMAVLKGMGGPEPRAIDVDSWAIGKWGAQVIMPSIRDWHSKSFDSKSDWFAWGVVTFQLFTGIHPYRGVLPGFDRRDMEGRMKANASVFAPGISLNRAVRDFSVIPGRLRDWYVATFQQGERTIPPSVFDVGGSVLGAGQIHRTVTQATGSLVYDKIYDDAAIRVFPCGIVMSAQGALYDLRSKRLVGTMSSLNGEVVKVDGGWVAADWVLGKPQFSFIDERSLTTTVLSLMLEGHQFLRYENRLFLATQTALVELLYMRVGKPILAIGPSTQILQPQSIKWFDGMGVQQALGATFVVLPFGEKSCMTVRIPELDGYVPIAGKSGNRFATVIGVDRTGQYHKFEFTFNAGYSSYQSWTGDVDSPELNIAILPKGVAATILDDGELTIFVPTNGQVRKVGDRMISSDMQLSHWEDKVTFIKDGAVWTLSLK
jgi:hypothetical protein